MLSTPWFIKEISKYAMRTPPTYTLPTYKLDCIRTYSLSLLFCLSSRGVLPSCIPLSACFSSSSLPCQISFFPVSKLSLSPGSFYLMQKYASLLLKTDTQTKQSPPEPSWAPHFLLAAAAVLFPVTDEAFWKEILCSLTLCRQSSSVLHPPLKILLLPSPPFLWSYSY